MLVQQKLVILVAFTNIECPTSISFDLSSCFRHPNCTPWTHSVVSIFIQFVCPSVSVWRHPLNIWLGQNTCQHCNIDGTSPYLQLGSKICLWLLVILCGCRGLCGYRYIHSLFYFNCSTQNTVEFNAKRFSYHTATFFSGNWQTNWYNKPATDHECCGNMLLWTTCILKCGIWSVFANAVTYLLIVFWVVSPHFSSRIRMTIIIILLLLVYLPLYKSSSNNVKRWWDQIQIAPNFCGIIFVNFMINPSSPFFTKI